MGYAPIHEVIENLNRRIKEFHWKLWYGDDSTYPSLDIRATFSFPVVIIDAAVIETSCAVVGNHSESLQLARNPVMEVPMDFAIVTCWPVSTLTGYYP